MKNITFLIIVLLFISFTAFSQSPCLPEGITFNTQEQIDNFQLNFPGCTEIEGDVLIFGGWSITNLAGLNMITSIGGDLDFEESHVLTSLTGLENLTSINGRLWIYQTDALSLTGIESLTSIGGDLWFTENESLANLSGLDNLNSVGGDILISGNPALTSLTGLESLVTINGNLRIGELDYGGNPSLVSIAALNNLTYIGGMLRIADNDALTSLTGLENVSALGGELGICYNFSLTNLCGLDNLTSIGGELYIIYNYLTNLTGLENLTSIVGGIHIWNNYALTSLAGLENLTYFSTLSIYNNFSLSACEAPWLCYYLSNPNGYVYIYGNADGCSGVVELAVACGGGMPCLPYGHYYFESQEDIDNFQSAFPNCQTLEGNVSISGSDINSLNGLNIVTSISGLLDINNNTTLTSITGINGLTSTGGLSIDGNNVLTNLMGLNNITSIDWQLNITGNSVLTSLTGLENLTFIGDDFSLYDNNALTSLTGLESLTTVNGSLNIGTQSYGGNPSLVNLTSLNNLTSIGGDLRIGYNDALISLTGIDNIEPNSINYLSIFGNDVLSTCDVQSICDYLTLPGAMVNISNNAPGCNSQEEIEEHCLTEVEETTARSGITLIPNPSKDIITISSPAINGNTFLSIFNVNGEKVIERQLQEPETRIDISALPRGVYFVRVRDEEMIEMEKIIKQ